MFNVTKAVDEFVETIKQVQKKNDKPDVVINAIKRKKKYFDDNDFLWDTETMFRLWKKIYINLMKEDGFEHQVQLYYDDVKKIERIRDKVKSHRESSAQRVKNIQNHLNREQKEFNQQLSGALNDLQEITNGIDKLDKKYGLIQAVDSVCSHYTEKMSPSKPFDQQLKDRKDLLNGLLRIFRGRTISSLPVLRRCFDSISATLGVLVDTVDDNHNERVLNREILNDIEMLYYRALNVVYQSMDYNIKKQSSIHTSEIGFITVVRRDTNYDYSPDIFGAQGVGGARIFNPEFMLKGKVFGGIEKPYINYITSTSNLFNAMKKYDRISNTSKNLFFGKEDIEFELIRRGYYNERILYGIGLYSVYYNYQQLKESKDTLSWPIDDSTYDEVLNYGSFLNEEDKQQLLNRLL